MFGLVILLNATMPCNSVFKIIFSDSSGPYMCDSVLLGEWSSVMI